jgi:CRP-like cAMP-binding protein
MQSRHYEKGQTIFSKDLVPQEIVVLASGSAELKCGDTSGDSRQVMPGEVFGLTETLAEAKYCDSLRALSDCEINVIGREDLISYLRSTPEACYRSLEVIAEMLHLARHKALGDH